ncbi:MAG: C40 family peptidase [Proteobacteria bacterium]|nr:C40 family peptidase [Pseudomonadota bacterium]
MSVRIICLVIFFSLSLKLSYAKECAVPPIAEGIEEPLYGVVIKGGNVILNTETDELFNKKNLASYIKPQSLALITTFHKTLPYVFIVTETVKGWFDKDNIQIIAPDEFDKILNSEKVLLLKSLTIDNIVYPPATKLPLLYENKHHYIVMLATNGEFKEMKISKKFATKPLKPQISSLKNLTRIFNKKPYVWANDEKGWDCSGLIQDMFSFVDISLPRNSYDQINFSESIDVSNYSLKEKEKVLNNSKPYFTLLYFPGHIMLYTGKKGKEYMSFQALSKIDNKKFGYVGYFPLKKTGLLKRVTKIGYISLENIDKNYSLLTNSKEEL